MGSTDDNLYTARVCFKAMTVYNIFYFTIVLS